MAISLPSRVIYSVDIPEITDFAAEFRYNFFAKDESVDEGASMKGHVVDHRPVVADQVLLHELLALGRKIRPLDLVDRPLYPVP